MREHGQVRLLVLASLLGCTPAAEPAAPAGDTAAEPCGDWASVGAPFVLTYCTSCHSSLLPEGSRYGAPAGMDFDSLAGVVAHQDRVAARALGEAPDMPPSGGVPHVERERLQRWLACGAPGVEAPLPAGERIEGLSEALTLSASVSSEGGELWVSFDVYGVPRRLQRYGTGVDGEGSLAGWEAYDVEGALLEAESYDPPLALYAPSAERLNTEVRTTHLLDGVETERSDSWEVVRAPEPDPDPRFTDAEVQRVEASRNGELAAIWWMSPRASFVAQAQRGGDGRWLVTLSQSPLDLREEDDAFPLEAGLSWAARGFHRESAP